MDKHHPVVFMRALPRKPSRRDVVRGLAGAGLGSAWRPAITGAKTKRKHK